MRNTRTLLTLVQAFKLDSFILKFPCKVKDFDMTKQVFKESVKHSIFSTDYDALSINKQELMKG